MATPQQPAAERTLAEEGGEGGGDLTSQGREEGRGGLVTGLMSLPRNVMAIPSTVLNYLTPKRPGNGETRRTGENGNVRTIEATETQATNNSGNGEMWKGMGGLSYTHERIGGRGGSRSYNRKGRNRGRKKGKK